MRSADHELVIEQGATFDIKLQYADKNGQAVDITGMVVRCQGRLRVDVGTTLFDWSTTNGKIVLSDPIDGMFKFSVSATETAALDFSRGL